MSKRDGWVKIGDQLSAFHRQLITTFPKYASIAVQELVLPENLDALLPEERDLLLARYLKTPSKSESEQQAETVPIAPHVDSKQYEDAQFNFFATGKQGDVVILNQQSVTWFLIQKILASDTENGHGVQINSIFSDDQPVWTECVWTSFFSSSCIGVDYGYGTVQAKEVLRIVITFSKNCSFWLTVFGKRRRAIEKA
jgi:hypothetical protein